MSYSSANTIATVAKREIAVAARTRGLIVSVIILLILVIGAPIAVSYFADDDEATAPRIATTEPAVLAGTGAEITEVSDRAGAEEAVRDGDVDAALVDSAGGWELLADGSVTASISTLSHQAVAAYESTRALNSVGVSLEDYTAALGPTEITEVDLSADATQTDGEMASILVALAGTFILVFAIITFAATIGSRVTEEKSSRVVELILASVRPLDFLAGKILGNVVFGLACVTLLTIAGAISLATTGMLDGLEFSWSVLPIMLVAFVLGMVFFGSLYAAAGAMIQRTEDLQSTQMPIMLLVFVIMYVPMFGWTAMDATWMQTVAWIPPISISTAPLQYAAGNMSLGEVGLSMLIMLAATIAVIWLVARIYRATILNNGQKMSWAKALRA